jgi:hypothetical protein
MSNLTTQQMIDYGVSWLDKQGNSTPRKMLEQLRDFTVMLLAPDDPPHPALIPGTCELTIQQFIEYAKKWMLEHGHLTPIQFLTQVRDGCNLFLGQLPKPANDFKCCMFYPHQLFGTSQIPQWKGSYGVDSLLGYSLVDGQSWASSFRHNGYAWIRGQGGNAAIYIADSQMHNNVEMQMRLTNRADPKTGQRIEASKNEVIIARNNYGVDKWIVSLFNDGDTCVSPAQFEQYIAEITGCYDWASDTQVAYMVCLETEDRFNASDTVKICNLIAKYAPTKRIIVGSQVENLLLSVADNHSSAELWFEQATHPTQQPLTLESAKPFIASLDRLSAKVGPAKVWGGEWWAKDKATRQNISRQILARGYNCGSGDYT